MDLELNLEEMLRNVQRAAQTAGGALAWPVLAAAMASRHAVARSHDAAPGAGGLPQRPGRGATKGSFDPRVAAMLSAKAGGALAAGHKVAAPKVAASSLRDAGFWQKSGLARINSMPLGDGKRCAGKTIGIAGPFSPATEV